MQSLALHLAVEGTAVDTQDSGGLGFISSGSFQGVDKLVFFTDIRGVRTRGSEGLYELRGILQGVGEGLRLELGAAFPGQGLWSTDLIGEVLKGDGRPFAEDTGPLDDMAELSDISRPGVADKGDHRLIGDPVDIPL